MRLHPAILASALWLAIAFPVHASSPVPEYELKAALLYNFTRFVEWPGAEAVAAFNICLVGGDPFGAAADALTAKTVGDKPIALRRLTSTDNPKSCHILFVAASEAGNVAPMLEAVKGQPVLTVSDTEGRARRDVIISLAVTSGRVTFDINDSRARSAGLVISSKLLRLARSVY